MTARVDFHIRPGVDYVHTITFSGVTLPTGSWGAVVRSKAGRTLLEPSVTLSAPSTLTVEADAAVTGALLTGEADVVVTDADDVAWAEGLALISYEGTGGEATGVPEGSTVGVTLQGVAVHGEDGEDGVSATDITYVHTQSLPVAEWEIAHPFATVMSIRVEDSFGDTIEGDEDLNSTAGVAVVSFGGGFSGRAYLIGIPA